MTTNTKKSNKLIGILLIFAIVLTYLGIMYFVVPLSGNQGLAQLLNAKRILENHKKDLMGRVIGNADFKAIDLDSFVNETQELVKMRGKRDLSSWISFRTFTPNISGKYIKTNDFGLRSELSLIEMIQQARLNKKSGKKNIIILGNSTAFGYGVAEDHKTITGYMNSEFKDEDYTVFNLAQGGYTSFMELFILSTIGIHFEPDIIITINGFSDTYHLAYPPQQKQLPLGLWAGTEKAQNSEFILNLYYKNLQAICKLAGIPNNRVILALQPVSGFENNSQIDISITKDFWAMYPKVREVAKLAAIKNGATFIDLSTLFKEEESSGPNFFDKSHLTEKGQKKVADVLIKTITSLSQPSPDVSFVPSETRESIINNIINANYTGSYRTADNY